MPAQYNIRTADPASVVRLQRDLALPRIAAATFAARGIDDADQARVFSDPSLERDWLSPHDIPGLDDVADALDDALRAHEHIVVFGDYDLDGISAATVLTRGLRALGGRATPFIPRRFDEGYGLSEAAYARVKELQPDLIVTVDCGISCKDEVDAIVADGVGVAVTDHHEAGANVPTGVPVADPKLDDACGSSVLAGVGVALKLVQILGSRRGFPHLWRSYTDLAALGTVADLMPMLGENRALVTDGLEHLNTNPRPCIAALAGKANSSGAPLTALNLSFTLNPRLNAAGRMGDADIALDILMCDNFDEAHRLVENLEEVNDRRRRVEADLAEAAKEKAREIYRGQRVLVVAGEGWHEGVKGIVASRLVRLYGVPVILFTIDGDEARGSGRSVGSVNLYAAVESTADLLTRFGGHEAAVGVTLPTANLDEFAKRLCAYMDELPDGAFRSMIDVDACVGLEEVTLEAGEMLDKLAPFGQGNQEPVFLARNVSLTNCRAVGADKNHLSCVLSNGLATIKGILFHCENIDALLNGDSIVDAAFSVQVETWRGRRSAKAMLLALTPAQTCSALRACLDPSSLRFLEGLFEHTPTLPKGSHDDDVTESGEADEGKPRSHWEDLAHEDLAALEAAVIESLIGTCDLHASQRSVLDRLSQGASTLAVMATGRGKSLVFQVHAAMRALTRHEASLFVYPLRALIADQSFHLARGLSRFGITCATLSGECSPAEREEVYRGLSRGKIDIVLTTPEYLAYHVSDIASSANIGFTVVDEAHHIGLARAGHREAYTQLGNLIEQLGCATVLAVTATEPDDVSARIDASLALDDRIVDDTERENLFLDDQRDIRHRDEYLANIVADGEKTVVYVNSREQSVSIARMIRRRVPQITLLVGFYNAGLTREERSRIEDLFRRDELKVLVATSAFGEGVDIPNIRHVFLYHLPFNEVEFNQMSGRAGRDGSPSTVHLLYGRQDVDINARILADSAPDHDVMAQVYRILLDRQRASSDEYFPVDDDLLSQLSNGGFRSVSPAAVACGIAVFRELGLIETRVSYTSNEEDVLVHVNEDPSKVDLDDSVRYREGMAERDVFESFCKWIMNCDARELAARVAHPIIARQWRQHRDTREV